MANCTLADFNILIKGERAPYSVTAFYRNPSANGQFTPDIRNPEWHKAYHTLAHSMSIANADAIMAIGSSLWRALMQDKVRDLWIAARADVEQGRVEGLRLRLDLQPPNVSALPWESLCDADRGVIFAAHPQFALVRVASVYDNIGPNRRTQAQLPLRVLIAAPDDPTQTIDREREIAEIRQIMDGFGPQAVQVEQLTGIFSITDLRAKLAKVKPTILHFIGHGEPTGLMLWPRGKFGLTPAQSLRAVMERSPSVKLVFLNSCLTGRPTGPRPFADIAAQLMQAGVPAIIAMQYQIRDHAAIDFAHFLYEELLGGSCPGIIDLAMSAARSGLYAANPGDFSFGTPVLWLNNEDGTIFPFGPTINEARTGMEVQTPTQPKTPTFDLAEEGEWIDTIVATTAIDHLTGELAILRSKWMNYVEELRNLLHQIASLRGQQNSPVYEEKIAEYRRFKAALLRVKRLIEDTNRNA